jgi:hypothetical protein
LLVIGALVAGLLATGVAEASKPYLHVTVFARTGKNMDSIVWTGSRFLYVVNTENTLWSAPAAGMPLTLIATMPKLVEETRCILSPGAHGFPTGMIFCHSPDNKIYEMRTDGSSLHVFATLPAPASPAADGALTFDDVGRFGYQLVAATGRSGAARPSGGVVYTVSDRGTVHEVGGYKGPGGADEVMIAPSNFGTLAGEALLTVDAGASGGHLVAMGPSGHSSSLASFPGDGPNSIVAIPAHVETTGSPAPGVYITDDLSQDIYYVSASQLARFAGDLFVVTEVKGRMWVVEPSGSGVRAMEVADTLRKKGHGIEQAILIG